MRQAHIVKHSPTLPEHFNKSSVFSKEKKDTQVHILENV